MRKISRKIYYLVVMFLDKLIKTVLTILQKATVNTTLTYRYNKKNQMTERTGAKGRTFYHQYDLQGNLSEESGSERGRYYYNPFNQQTKAERSDGYIQENLYDGEGLRAGINNLESSARFVFYNGELLTETKEEVKTSIMGMV